MLSELSYSKIIIQSFIDKFSKHAVILYLDDRNHITIIVKQRLYFSLKGKPRNFIIDSEFNSVNIKDVLHEQSVMVHYTKPNSHTGNADIERFRSSLGDR